MKDLKNMLKGIRLGQKLVHLYYQDAEFAVGTTFPIVNIVCILVSLSIATSSNLLIFLTAGSVIYVIMLWLCISWYSALKKILEWLNEHSKDLQQSQWSLQKTPEVLSLLKNDEEINRVKTKVFASYLKVPLIFILFQTLAFVAGLIITWNF